MKNFDKKIKIEAFIVVFILIISIISLLIIHIPYKNFDDAKKNIKIYRDGILLTEIDGKPIDINVDNTFVIGDINTTYNIIEIKDKKVRCIDASCPDKICMHHEFLRSDIINDAIICAPNRLMITY